MGSCNESKTIIMVERLGNILAESVACTTGRYSPAAPVVGVGPEQIAHWAFVGHFLYTIERPNVI
jgi:hypothetical protein